MFRRAVYYTGRVQGVGFRFAVQQLAAGYDVGGFVRNLADGRVELVLESRRREEVDGVLNGVRERFRDYIDAVDDQPCTPTGEFNGFEIRR